MLTYIQEYLSACNRIVSKAGDIVMDKENKKDKKEKKCKNKNRKNKKRKHKDESVKNIPDSTHLRESAYATRILGHNKKRLPDLLDLQGTTARTL